ncbi:Siderophore triacetylfusarinine C esterase [Pseudocercospora fuligena]|uniref:Siderophore triacetylfusarinine C esterase n=1 Tax=Pseudocercospora fuligena TaxID=685502 RepID=A0A8H6VE59_9PEZI|nr:Siderophore triacetylfusarinine C esterase [Pseudocercospora fuligena]
MCAAIRAAGQPEAIALPNSEQFYLDSDQGDEYLIQVSWPLHWQDVHTTERSAVPMIYIVDGNALFLTATEVAWRRSAASHFAGGGIVVAVGYPLKQGKLYDAQRRSLDLTPPSAAPIEGYGGADRFLDFIEAKVRPAVRDRLPKVAVSREALYGHSYGGLFALHALFSRPLSFDCFMASSPSIWWNSRCVLHEAKTFLEQEQNNGEAKNPSLMLFLGALEQHPPRWDNEPLDHFEARKQIAKDLRMEDNLLDLCKMLKGCNRLHTIQKNLYELEEHTSVMACSMSRSLTMFFEDWPFHPS